VAPSRHRRDLPGDPLRHLVLPGDRGVTAGRRGVARPQARHPAGHDLGADDARHHRGPHVVAEHRGGRGARRSSASPRHRCSTGSRASSARGRRPSSWR
jgi:hypothetical protein